MQHVYRTITLMGSVMYAVPGSIQKDVRKLIGLSGRHCNHLRDAPD
jgi:hypothetical protein